MTVLGATLAAAFTCGWLPMYAFRAESLSDALPSYAGSERLWVCVTPVVLSLHMAAGCVLLTLAPRIPAASALLGVGTFAGALAFWFWGRASIGPLRRRRLPDAPPERFCRDGAFGIVRHPLYFGYLLAASAPLFVVPHPTLAATFASCAVALAIRALQEERRLRRHLGASYDAYCRTVKRLLPFVW